MDAIISTNFQINESLWNFLSRGILPAACMAPRPDLAMRPSGPRLPSEVDTFIGMCCGANRHTSREAARLYLEWERWGLGRRKEKKVVRC
jgi:hypothetical protein